MNCGEAQDLIHAYLDGELDVAGAAEVERHLETCAACAALSHRHQALSTALRDGTLSFEPPPDWAGRVRAAVRRAHPASVRLHRVGISALRIAASFALVAVVSWSLATALQRPAAEERMLRDVIAGHVRSLQATHLTDVASSDQHTVKPWFAGKLDFSPQVADLAGDGFPLIGGRLDYLDDRPVAALVYQRRKHVINVFIWPANGQIAAERSLSHQGFHVVRWSNGELAYWAISDVQAGDLADFVHAFRTRGSPTAAP